MTTLIRRTAIAILLTAGAPGCDRLMMRDHPGDVQRVEPPTPQPPASPADQNDIYARAYQKGIELAERGQPGLAVGYFEQAVTLRPDSDEACLALGACYESMGDPIRAIRQYRQVLARNSADVDAYANLGTSYIKLYYRERNEQWLTLAREAWQSSLALNPDQPDVRNFLARVDGKSDPAKR